jgi:hypothetical protein
VPQTSLAENQQKSSVKEPGEVMSLAEQKYNIAKVKKQNFYVTYGPGFYGNFSIVALSFILLLFYFNKQIDTNLISLISVGIGLYAFSNVVEFAPLLQGRVKGVASLFILAAAIHLQLTLKRYNWSRKRTSYLNKGLTLFLISSIPMFLFHFSYILENFSLFSIFLPQVSWFLGDDDFSIRTAIGIFL